MFGQWSIVLVDGSWRMVFVILYILSGICATFFNSIVLLAICKGESLRENSCKIVCALSITDLLMGLSGFLLVFDMLSNREGNYFRDVCHTIVIITFLASSNLTAFIGFDRYLRMTQLTNYNLSDWCIKGVVSVCWVLPCVTALFIHVVKHNAIAFLPAVELFLLFVMIVICYVLILKALRKLRAQHTGGLIEEYLKNERHATNTIVIIATCFIAMKLPFIISLAMRAAKIGSDNDVERMIAIGVYLSFSNSIVNPIVYSYRMRRIRQDIMRLLSRKTGHEPSTLWQVVTLHNLTESI